MCFIKSSQGCTECLIDKVIIGEIQEDETINSYILEWGNIRKNKNYKKIYRSFPKIIIKIEKAKL